MSNKTREIDAGQYSSLSNNSIGWNNSVGCQRGFSVTRFDYTGA